jgi:hypothetical protein
MLLLPQALQLPVLRLLLPHVLQLSVRPLLMTSHACTV